MSGSSSPEGVRDLPGGYGAIPLMPVPVLGNGTRGYVPGVFLPSCGMPGREGAGLYDLCEYDVCPVIERLGIGRSFHGPGVLPGVRAPGVGLYPMSPAPPIKGWSELKLAHDASDVCVITRCGPAGLPFISGIGGAVPTVSLLSRAVPGLEVYSGRVVIVVWRDNGARESVLESPRLGSVGCFLIPPPSLAALASRLACNSTSCFSAVSTLTLTSFSIRRLIF